jgi:hypothetical protein
LLILLLLLSAHSLSSQTFASTLQLLSVGNFWITVYHKSALVIFHHLLVVPGDGVRWCLWTAATSGPIVHLPDDIWAWSVMVEWYWQGKIKELREKTCPSATLSTTNPAWIDLGAKSVLHGERLATNLLSHGTAFHHLRRILLGFSLILIFLLLCAMVGI